MLEGSVQRDRNEVRVNAQLIDADSGAHLWSDRFEDELGDILRLQDKIVARLVSSLSVEVVRSEARVSNQKLNPDAIDLTMRGIALMQSPKERASRETFLAARSVFDQALKIDANNAYALAGSALAYVFDFSFGSPDPKIDYSETVLARADKALEIDPGNTIAINAKVMYLIYAHQLGKAVSVSADGLQANPNSPYLLGGHALASVFSGYYQQAASDLTEAIKLSPRDTMLGDWHFTNCSAEFGLGHLDAAVGECKRSIEAGYNVYNVYRNLASLYALQGKMDEAKTALDDARRLNPKFTIEFASATAPKIPNMLDGLRKAGLAER